MTVPCSAALVIPPCCVRVYALKWMEARLCRVYERLRGGNLGIFRCTFLLAEKERLQPVSGAVAYCAGVGIKQTQEET